MPWRNRLIASTRSSRSVTRVGVLGLDLAQFLVGAQVDGAESLAVALELLQLRLDFRDVGKRRVGCKAGKTRQRFRLGLQDLADFGGEIGEPPLDPLVTLFRARGPPRDRRESPPRFFCRAVSLHADRRARLGLVGSVCRCLAFSAYWGDREHGTGPRIVR
jgi:hypothetical protein